MDNGGKAIETTKFGAKKKKKMETNGMLLGYEKCREERVEANMEKKRKKTKKKKKQKRKKTERTRILITEKRQQE